MEQTKAVDRISELPESIFHHIMSFLTCKQVVQASGLSKTWLKAWHTYPVLQFNRKFFEEDFQDSSRLPAWRSLTRRDRRENQIESFLEITLSNREKQPDKYMEKFTLQIGYFGDPKFESLVERWICYVVECNVRELKLEDEKRIITWFFLPQIIYSAKSVNVLKLKNCALAIPKCKVKLDSLRKLYLSNVFADDKVIHDIIAGCPMIEDLCLSACKGIKILESFDLHRLKKVKVRKNYRLGWVSFKELNVQSIVLSLTNFFHDIIIDSCKSLKCLKLFKTCITDEWLHNRISELPLLEYLVIQNCINLDSIRVSSSSLKTLEIDSCMKATTVLIHTPNLTEFTYVGNVIFFSSNALALSEVDITICSHNIVNDTQWYVGYIQLLENFRHSKVLNVRSWTDEAVIIPAGVRQIQSSPLFGVKHVNFKSGRQYGGSTISKILDDFLWIAPHAETISIKSYRNCIKSSFKFSYKNQIDCVRDTATCYKSFPISCWQHCINLVEIENTMILEEGTIIKWHVLWDHDIMEKINDLKDLGVLLDKNSKSYF